MHNHGNGSLIHTGCIGPGCPHCPKLDRPGVRQYLTGTKRRIDPNKPRLSFDQLAAVNRCQKAKAAGLPCREFELRPRHIVHVQLPGHFNCGMAEFEGQTLLASRFGWHGQIYLSRLDERYQPVWTRKLNLAHPKGKSGVEDPRLFIFRGQLHVSYSGYHKDGEDKTTMLLARLDSELQVEKVWMPEYDKRQEWEKNWQSFEHDDTLYSVYTVRPHVILKHDGERAEQVASTPCPIKLTCALRGGAPPVRIGDEYYHFFHTQERKELVHYGLGVYTFDAVPPFAIRRRCDQILFTTGDRIHGYGNLCMFPCGAIRRGDEWAISYGWQDRECRIAFFDAAEIERRMR